jgi:hypothetical protein
VDKNYLWHGLIIKMHFTVLHIEESTEVVGGEKAEMKHNTSAENGRGNSAFEPVNTNKNVSGRSSAIASPCMVLIALAPGLNTCQRWYRVYDTEEKIGRLLQIDISELLGRSDE